MSRLIIKNLPKNVTDTKLRQLFSEKGVVTDLQLKYTEDGKFRRFGFIGYKTKEEADTALQYFNGVCIDTCRITVEYCSELGNVLKPKSWSKYAPDSAIHKLQQNNEDKDKKDKKKKTKKNEKSHTQILNNGEIKKEKKKQLNKDNVMNDEVVDENNKKRKIKKAKDQESSKVKEIIKKHINDPLFNEFIESHTKTKMWTNDILLSLTENNDFVDKSKNYENVNNSEDDENSDKESIAKQNITDKEYMESLKKNLDDLKNSEILKAKKEHGPYKFFTVKIQGLAYNHKKKDVKQFFKEIKPKSIRVPNKIKGIAYVGFKTERQMKLALNKNKCFLGGKRINISKYIKKENNNETKTSKLRWKQQEETLKCEESIAESGRIFLRNLSYMTNEDDITKTFEKYGPLTEVNIPIDKITRKSKGFGTITFLMPEHAVKAYTELDGSIQDGRMLHLLPAKSKTTLEDLLLQDGLSFKQKKELEAKITAGSSHNWNTLFLGHNAVADAIAGTYNTTKENVLLDNGKGTSAAVRLALGETQLVEGTKKFLEDNDVRLNAFNQASNKRSKTVILVKNLPSGSNIKEIREKFVAHGKLGRVILPPSGVTAIVEFIEPSEARKAFTRLAYTKFNHLPLYLEWAPDDTFTSPLKISKESKKDITDDVSEIQTTVNNTQKIKITKKSNKNKIKLDEKENEKNITENKQNEKEKNRSEIKEKQNEKEKKQNEKENKQNKKENNQNANESEDEDEPEPETTLFVKNLNFHTTTEELKKYFSKCGPLHYASISMKKDPQNPGKKLSMGYGFVRYKLKLDAERALKDLQMSSLDGKTLELKRSERTLQSDIKIAKKSTKMTEQIGTKILVRNIPFQANADEIKDLFKAFGETKSVRLPRKLVGDENHRGFGFVEFYTKKEAKRAFAALCQSTHLYGRRLVLEWAQVQEDIEQLRKRTAKHFHQDSVTRNKKSRLNPENIGLQVQ